MTSEKKEKLKVPVPEGKTGKEEKGSRRTNTIKHDKILSRRKLKSNNNTWYENNDKDVRNKLG